jgi:hypothetical protein
VERPGELVFAAAVGAAGVPVNVGEAIGASSAASLCTIAVVAIWVVFVPCAAVVEAGVPVNVGEASSA